MFERHAEAPFTTQHLECVRKPAWIVRNWCQKFFHLAIAPAAGLAAIHNTRDTPAVDGLVAAIENAIAQTPACISTVSFLESPNPADPAYVNGMTANCFPLTDRFNTIDSAVQNITAADYTALNASATALNNLVAALTTLRTSDKYSEIAFDTGGAPCESVAVCSGLVAM